MDVNTAYGILHDMFLERQAKKEGRPYKSWVREYVEKMYEAGPAPMQALLKARDDSPRVASLPEPAFRPAHKLTSLGRCVPIPPECIV